MSAWHVGTETLRAYAARELDALARASVESHVTRCEDCRDELTLVAGRSVGPMSFEQMWERVQTRIEHAPAARVTRVLRRLGIAEPDAVVVRQIARQCLQWTIATTLVLALAALAATLGRTDTSRLGFVLLAPLLPPVGVAVTYRLTPTGTALLETTAPYPPARLLLWRTAHALITAVPAAVAFGAVVPGNTWMAVAWLLPSAACTGIVLVASTWFDPAVPAGGVSMVWGAVVITWHLRHLTDAIAAPSTQLVSLVVTAAAGAAFVRRLTAIRPTSR